MIVKIGYIGGFWASNIGNSFYNLGALSLLKSAFVDDEIFFIPDPPGWMWKVQNNYDFISKIDVDMAIISGPCLNYRLKDIYERTFNEFKKNNVKIAFISSGASEYTVEEAKFVQNFLSNYSIEFIMTRDEETYNLHKDGDIPVYNGICTSMFLNDAIKPIPVVNSDDYYVYNFSYFHEPYIKLHGDTVEVEKKKLFKYQYSLNGINIIRTNNAYFCRFKQLIFNRREMYYSDLPYGYISILGNAKTVFSDRVHSCAATLIMGGKAMYIKGSKRSSDGRNKLFSRLKLNDIYGKPVQLDFQYVNNEKMKVVSYLKTYRAD